MSELNNAKKRAWKWCSLYVRAKECIETTGSIEYGMCCTCGAIKPFKELDAGHYISGRNNSILFVLDGIHIQCRYCNRFREGRKDEYENYMLNRYGKEVCDKLKSMKHLPKKFSLFELKALEQTFKKNYEDFLIFLKK